VHFIYEQFPRKEDFVRFGYRGARYACYTGYITQAIVNNLAPLLFIIFSDRYGVSYRGLGTLVMLNFLVQLTMDLICIKIVPFIGYKPLLVAAEACSAAGFILLGILPLVMKPVFAALVIAFIVYGAGGGLLEVLVSPVMEAIPGGAKGKPAAMALLHSFYCWGQMGVILITTFALLALGLDLWFALPVLWAIIPLLNMFLFIKAPMVEVLAEKETTKLRVLVKKPEFFLCVLMMFCAGASEQGVSQWASLFAERALSLPKVFGDVAGPAMFALCMGIGRMIYGIRGGKIKIFPYMVFCSALCFLCYLGIALVPHPLVQLAACALTGFSVAIMWPVTLSLSSSRFPAGGAALFAVLALMGDLGCASGPALVGFVSDASLSLRTGILACAIFPGLNFLAVFVRAFRCKKS
jgi:MFS family permease